MEIRVSFRLTPHWTRLHGAKEKEGCLNHEIQNVIDKSEKKEGKNARDKALILIGFSGGFRRSELVNIDFEDLEFTKEGVKIFIKRSKTDQSGEGMIKAIPFFKEKDFCPVIFLKNWIEISKINKGFIFDISAIIACKILVLPQPTLPIMPTSWPCFTFKFNSFRIDE